MADRKLEILEATCRVIAREGTDGLRMGTVAAEAGVSSALLHYYFATRADLLMQAFDHADTKADEAAEAALVGIPDPLDRLRRLLLIYAGGEAVFREDWVLWVEMWRSAIFDERLAESVRRSSETWIGSPVGGLHRARHQRRRRHGAAVGRRRWAGAADPHRHPLPRPGG
jgi:AcrR family transcriptional regulator